MTTTVQNQVLINARALIAERAHWTTGTLACTANGRRVAWHDQSATKWCALGAIYRAAYDLVGDPKEAMRIGNGVARSISRTRWFGGRLPIMNDTRGHAAVLAAFDKALAAA
jgi:hypothetical protein